MHDDDDDDANNNNNKVILYWDKPIITDKTVDRRDTVFIDRQKKATLTTDIEVPLTLKLSTTKAEKITKCENLALEIKNFWKLNNVSVYSLVISMEAVVTRSFLKYIENTGLKKHLKSGAKSSTVTNVSCSTQTPRTRHLFLRDRMNFFPLTEPNVTDSLRHR
jgi:hypothetical protein